MGNYLNPDHRAFKQILKNKIYVDKSLLIEKTNEIVGSNESKLCVSRPRRFGKSTDANMLVAYYSKGADSSDLFDSLKIGSVNSYHKHLNKHNVIYLNIQEFLSESKDVASLIHDVTDAVLFEILKVYNNIDYQRKDILSRVLKTIFTECNESFVFIIDEWDCILRNTIKGDYETYLDFLRTLLKDQPYVDLVYMTGILPIKKYGTHSALNMFDEISMILPTPYEQFMGFTEEEVRTLCNKHGMEFGEMQRWYNGYHFKNNISIYSPRSVILALNKKEYSNYWTNSETYESLAKYIAMNFDGLKEAIIRLLSGEYIDVNVNKFQNDMTTFKSKDDILTLLVHLGYLGYSFKDGKVYIPNYEVESTFITSIEELSWDHVSEAIINSKDTLEALWMKDEEKVAQYIEKAHLETSILQYNDENALAYTVYLALLAAKNDYTMIRELPSGRGFADIAFIPFGDKPAILVELKWNKDADSAINQIKDKKYPTSLEKYKEDLIMVGINYDKETKKHTCKIE